MLGPAGTRGAAAPATDARDSAPARPAFAGMSVGSSVDCCVGWLDVLGEHAAAHIQSVNVKADRSLARRIS